MRVLVCGSNHGASYLGALRYLGNHELVGLLARGSARSREAASSFDVPLLTSIDDVVDVDVACVAVGGAAGQEIALALLRRGVAVLREHPVTATALDELLAAADAGGTRVHVSAHFADFAPSSAFVAFATTLRSASAPLLIQVSADAQLLWGILDILATAMGSADFLLEAPVVRSLPADKRLRVATCFGSIAGVPVVLTYGLNLGVEDNGSMGFFGDEVSMDFYRGRLCLVGVEGTVVMHRNGWAQQSAPPPRKELTALYLGNGTAVEIVVPPPSGELEMMERRFRASALAVDRLLAHASGGPAPVSQTPEYLRGLTLAFRHLMTPKFVQFDATPLIRADGASSSDGGGGP